MSTALRPTRTSEVQLQAGKDLRAAAEFFQDGAITRHGMAWRRADTAMYADASGPRSLGRRIVCVATMGTEAEGMIGPSMDLPNDQAG